jgi:undecaprenyl diphosphate synthase
VRATQLFAQDVAAGLRQPNEMTEEMMYQYLWTAQLGEFAEVDLMIRTSGEHRVSNFLLWQAAYAELYFHDINWPDFGPQHLMEAIKAYSLRDRRFGCVSKKVRLDATRTSKEAHTLA